MGRSYTELPGFDDLVLEESYVLDIRATPGTVVFDVDFVLTRDHPAYSPPRPNEVECFVVGRFRFDRVRRLHWDYEGIRPAINPDGELDWGNIDAFTWNDNVFVLEGDWGRIEIHAEAVTVHVEPTAP